MMEIVLFYGAINTIAELIFLGMLPPRARLAILGSRLGQGSLHVMMLCLTLWVHWGTLTGTMGAFTALIFSFPAVWFAQLLWGYTRVTTNLAGQRVRIMRRGIINYSVKEMT